jgi:hypothetical protein
MAGLDHCKPLKTVVKPIAQFPNRHGSPTRRKE